MQDASRGRSKRHVRLRPITLTKTRRRRLPSHLVDFQNPARGRDPRGSLHTSAGVPHKLCTCKGRVQDRSWSS